MPAATAAVTTGSAHCGGKCDGCAKISPMNVATALIVACRATLSVVRSICTRRATVTSAPTMPHTEASCACSSVKAAKMLPRAITRKQASQAPANFSAAGRARPLARRSSNVSTTLNLRLGMTGPFFPCCVRRGVSRWAIAWAKSDAFRRRVRSIPGEPLTLPPCRRRRAGIRKEVYYIPLISRMMRRMPGPAAERTLP